MLLPRILTPAVPLSLWRLWCSLAPFSPGIIVPALLIRWSGWSSFLRSCGLNLFLSWDVPTSGGSPHYFFLPATSPVYGETSSHLSLSRTQASESGPCSDCQDLGRSSSETLGILDRCLTDGLGALPPAPSVCGGSGLPPLKTQQPNPLHTCPHVI